MKRMDLRITGRPLSLLLWLLLPWISLHAQREVSTFNDGWRFLRSDTAEVMNVSYNDSAWERISLPHSWNTDAYTEKAYYQGKAWYRKQFTLPAAYQDKQLYLKFEAASKAATIYINGQRVGEHRGGYTAFTLDITPYCSTSTPHTIAVCVDNSRQDIPPISGDFTFFGGIYRDVWLIAVPRQHFDLLNLGSDGIFLHTPRVSAEKSTVAVRSEIRNTASTGKKVEIQHRLLAPDGSVLHTLSRKVQLEADGAYSYEDTFPEVVSPLLWTPETPHLYQVESLLKDTKTGEVTDRLSHYTGFRWFSFDGKEGFFLNGMPYKLNGVCRHQDQKPIGPALSDEMHRRDMLLIKEMGANFIRISHYPQDPAILEQCDKLGLLVWEEIPVIDIVPDTEGYGDACEQNLREMIRQHYNHPSVISWGYMNEILLVTQRRYQTEEELKPVLERTLALANRLEKALKEEDPYRVSSMAFHGSNSYNEYGLGDITDVVGWNLYQGWYGGEFSGFDRFLAEQHQRYPDHPIIVSEYGANSDRRVHSLEPRRFDFSMEYQQLYLEHYLPVIAREPYIAGGTHWNFIDFSSALRDESMPRINSKGLVYANRTPKDVYYYFQAMFRKDIPVLHIASRDWYKRSGIQEGTNEVIQPVKIYTNLPEVELFVNGVSIGNKGTVNCTAVFDVPFRKGDNFPRAVSATPTGEATEDGMQIRFTPVPDRLTAENIRDVELAVNTGSHCFYTGEESGLTWLPDRPYTPGGWGYLEHPEAEVRDTQTEIRGTLDNPLFQTLRIHPGGYRFDVPQGMYEVELLFADIFRQREQLAYQLGGASQTEEQSNVFDIRINDRCVEKAFSPSQVGGHFHALRKHYLVYCGDGKLEITLPAIQGVSLLNGIKIRKL
ncbi:MAG: DUF4982 domain-containing protein [Bacteroides sp.]|nr:DUF4982 domain-containing protein [Bacteroides sp.]